MAWPRTPHWKPSIALGGPLRKRPWDLVGTLVMLHRIRSYPLSFWATWLITFCFFASLQLLLPEFPLFISELGGGPDTVGVLGSLVAVGALAARPLTGRLADGWSRRGMLGLAIALLSGSTLLYVIASNLWWLVPARLVQGIALSLTSTGSAAIAASLAPLERRGEALGLMGMAVSLALIVAPPLAPPLRVAFGGFEPLFLTAAAVPAVGLIALISVGRTPRREPTRDGGFLVVLGDRALWPMALAVATLGLAFGGVGSFVPLLAEQRALGNAGLFFSLYAIGYSLAIAPLGALSDRVGRAPVLVPLLVLVALVQIALAAVYQPLLFLIVATLLGVGIGGSRSVVDALTIELVGAERHGRALSVNYGAFDLGIGVGSAALGFLAVPLGYSGLFRLLGALVLGGALLFALLGWQRRVPPVPVPDVSIE